MILGLGVDPVFLGAALREAGGIQDLIAGVKTQVPKGIMPWVL